MNRKRLAYRVVFFCCAAAVLYLALTPRPPADPLAWDKANHAAAFVTLALWGAAGWPAHFAAVLVGLLAYGSAIEVLQAFTPTRTGDPRDLAADAVGLVLAWGIVQGLRWLRRRRSP